MRIICGIAKGRKLYSPTPHDRSIRPTSDRTREALFSILGNHVIQARVLDLFAGTGALGLEAFSRNAELVVLVDNNRVALELIKKNISLCTTGYTGCGKIHTLRYNLVKNLPIKQLSMIVASRFDLIFIDPPYGLGISKATLKLIDKSSLLAQNGLVIIEERFNIDLPRKLSKLQCIDSRIYGETALYFYTLSQPA